MSAAALRRLCVAWPRFGPYHLARLQAAHRILQGRGVEVVGLETASDDALYAWDIETGAVPFRREQAFPGRVYESIGPREMEHGITAALDRIRPDAVAITSYSLPDARACLAWCRRNRAVAVLMTDTTEGDAPRTGWREAIKRVLVAQYDAALVSGTAARRYLEGLGFPHGLIFSGYDVVDNAFFAASADAARARAPRGDLPGLSPTAPFFLASARFVARKNVVGLLNAYAAYRRAAESERRTPWGLTILGGGPEQAAVEAEARGTAGVTLPGFRQAADLPDYYAHASAFVLPSLVDQWGLVVNEAMASGLPVLVSERAGCAEDLVREGVTGYTFNPADRAALAEVLRKVAGLPEATRAQMGAAARAHIAAWGLEAFTEGLWAAATEGLARADRPLALPARLLLSAIRAAQRRPHSFHAIRE